MYGAEVTVRLITLFRRPKKFHIFVQWTRRRSNFPIYITKHFFISLYKRKPFPFHISSNILGHFLSVSEFRQIFFFRLLESSVAFVYFSHQFFDISIMSKDAFSLHIKIYLLCFAPAEYSISPSYRGGSFSPKIESASPTQLSSAKRANPRYFINLCGISCEFAGFAHRPIVDSESTIAG